jgi:hypothetical protein
MAGIPRVFKQRRGADRAFSIHIPRRVPRVTVAGRFLADADGGAGGASFYEMPTTKTSAATGALVNQPSGVPQGSRI